MRLRGPDVESGRMQHHQPRWRKRQRECDGYAGAYSATNKGGGFPPQRVAFSAPAYRRFSIPLRLSPACFPGRSLRQRNGRLEPPARAPLLVPRQRPTSGPPGARVISLSFQAPGRPHVGDGWRHPRPVAANDAPIVSSSCAAPGIGTRAFGAMRSAISTNAALTPAVSHAVQRLRRTISLDRNGVVVRSGSRPAALNRPSRSSTA
jgi:hypothetical protein